MGEAGLSRMSTLMWLPPLVFCMEDQWLLTTARLWPSARTLMDLWWVEPVSRKTSSRFQREPVIFLFSIHGHVSQLYYVMCVNNVRDFYKPISCFIILVIQ